MTKQEYLTSLLELCTPPQRTLFNRMYPNGPGSAQLARAIAQVEATLRNLNKQVEQLVDIKKAHIKEVETYTNDIKGLQQSNAELKTENDQLNAEVNRLSSDHINVKNADVTRRLDMLDALEAGGVDNWEWYDESLKDMK